MRFAATLKSGSSMHKVDFDLSHVEMSAEQKTIATKLFEKAKSETIDVEKGDVCEQGKCLASKYLEPGEFQQIRGLKSELGSQVTQEAIIIDFCIHVVRLPARQ